MPTQYDNIVTAIETLSIKKQTLGFIKNRLLDEEARHTDSSKKHRNEYHTSSAFNARFNGRNIADRIKKSSTGGETPRSKFKCFRCGDLGHKRLEEGQPQATYEWKKVGKCNC